MGLGEKGYIDLFISEVRGDNTTAPQASLCLVARPWDESRAPVLPAVRKAGEAE